MNIIMRRLALGSFIATITACNHVGFAPSQVNLGSYSAQGISLASTSVNTKKDHPVTFAAGQLNGQYLGSISLGQTPGVNSMATANGTFQIVNASTYQITYTPNTSFVGVDQMQVYATDVYGNAIPGAVIVTVGNIINSIQPALAVRGMSCITCHSTVSSNIVTDYGSGSPWYFDTSSSDSYYFDRLGTDNGLATLSLLNNANIIVPNAPVPASIQSQFNVTSLSQFIQARFAQGSTNAASQVQQINSLQITIPTASRIQQLFNNPTANQVYLPDTQNSPALQGLNFDATNGVFLITNLVCDGDLYLSAPALFENATVSSINGCRIYSTASIFVDGILTSAPYQNSTNYNTQLLSAISIWIGVGHMSKNGSFCERDANNNPTGWYSSSGNTGVDCTQAANAMNAACDSFGERTSATLARNTYSRAYPDATSLQALLGPSGTVAQERAQLEASLGSVLYDASCTASGRGQAMSRLMLVAPYVSDRFNGDFSGSTISEAALMSLGTFKFQFDPIFSKVSVFSLLDPDELISGDGL